MNSFGEVATKAAVKSLTKVNVNGLLDKLSVEEVYVLGFTIGSGWAQFNQLTDEGKQRLIDSYQRAFSE